MYFHYLQILALVVLLSQVEAYAFDWKFSRKEIRGLSNEVIIPKANELEARGGGNFYVNILRALLRSKHASNIIQDLANAPCDEVQSLFTDADEATQFFEQIGQGQVPSIIKNAPSDAVAQITNLISVATMVPSTVLDFATAAVTDAADVINSIEDGSITSVLTALPSELYSDVTMGFTDLTSAVVEGFNGLSCDIFNDCPSSTATSGVPCSVPVSANATTTPVNSAAVTPSNGSVSTINTSTDPVSTSNSTAANSTSAASSGSAPSPISGSLSTSLNASAMAFIGIFVLALLL